MRELPGRMKVENLPKIQKGDFSVSPNYAKESSMSWAQCSQYICKITAQQRHNKLQNEENHTRNAERHHQNNKLNAPQKFKSHSYFFYFFFLDFLTFTWESEEEKRMKQENKKKK
jgi:hypothetical protein